MTMRRSDCSTFLIPSATSFVYFFLWSFNVPEVCFLIPLSPMFFCEGSCVYNFFIDAPTSSSLVRRTWRHAIRVGLRSSSAKETHHALSASIPVPCCLSRWREQFLWWLWLFALTTSATLSARNSASSRSSAHSGQNGL